jgi:hypothetical protein
VLLVDAALGRNVLNVVAIGALHFRRGQMKKIEKQSESRSSQVNASLAAAALAAIGFCNSAHGALVIQQIYGDGGFDTNAVYKNDYIDLYNSGSSGVDLTGINVEYGSSSGAVGANTFEYYPLPSAILPAGGFFLIELGGGTNGAALPVTPNENYSNTSIYTEPSFSSGKLAIITASGSILDYVTYGTKAAASGTWPGWANNTLTLGYGVNGGTAAAAGPLNDSLALTRGAYTGSNNVDFSYVAPNPQATAVPEPATLGILASAGALLLARRRTRS